jgi:DNA replication ATP-dependent helicase Dna2
MMQPWFDLVLIDEASQLDVAMSTLVVSKAADGAAFVLAGDDLQLAPIQRGTQERCLHRQVGEGTERTQTHTGNQ